MWFLNFNFNIENGLKTSQKNCSGTECFNVATKIHCSILNNENENDARFTVTFNIVSNNKNTQSIDLLLLYTR